MSNNDKSITVRFKQEELDALKRQAKAEDRSVSNLLRQIVKWYVNK